MDSETNIASQNVIIRYYCLLIKLADHAQHLVLLAFRLYLAKVFWAAGMTKIASWSTTLDLFAYEYSVPVISPVAAAYMATAAELAFPVLLVIGLASRFSAAGLFVLNFVAVISYPDISPGGINDHYFWGAMLLTLMFFGPGKAAADHFFARKFCT